MRSLRSRTPRRFRVGVRRARARGWQGSELQLPGHVRADLELVAGERVIVTTRKGDVIPAIVVADHLGELWLRVRYLPLEGWTRASLVIDVRRPRTAEAGARRES